MECVDDFCDCAIVFYSNVTNTEVGTEIIPQAGVLHNNTPFLDTKTLHIA